LHERLQVAVGGGDPAHVGSEGLRSADPLEPPLLQHAQQLRLQLGLELGHLVQEERPALGELDAPAPAGGGAGERALLVAEQLALEQGLGQCGAVHRDEGSRRPGAPGVHRPRRHLLADAALAQQQDGGVGAGHLPERRLHGTHHRGPPRERRDDAAGAIALLAPIAQRAPLHGARHQQPQRLRPLDRLLEVVEGPELHGLDGGLHRPVRGEDDDLELGLLGGGLAHQRHAVHPRHAEIRHQDMEAFRVEPARGLGAVGRLPYVVTVRLQGLGEEGPDPLVVVHHQDARHRRRPSGNHDAELRATSRVRPCRDAASVQLGDAARDRKPQAGAVHAGSVKGFEEALRIAGRQTRALVPDAEDEALPVHRRRNAHSRAGG
jgi:hypothetical protein